MKHCITILLLFFHTYCWSQKIAGVQVFNPQTNDNIPVIAMDEQLVIRFDDLSNSGKNLQYTIRHLDRNWQEDGLFFTEIAEGKMSVPLTNEHFAYSFNTIQPYTHYEIIFPNEDLRPKISGNFELIVYEYDMSRPVYRQRFAVHENLIHPNVLVSRIDLPNSSARHRIEVNAAYKNRDFSQAIPSLSLSLVQNNNSQLSVHSIRPTATTASSLLFQSMDMVFPGNSEFYYFDNKNIQRPSDMVAGAELVENRWNTYLFPAWAYPENYQYQPDVNGAYYFRRNDTGIERDAKTEGDYSWVHFYLESPEIEDDLYVTGIFNQYQAGEENRMKYNATLKRYEAKLYLKQGFYSYLIALKRKGSEVLDFGAVNGNFWQTENLYQAFIYYTPFGRNYDGLAGYGEYRRLPK